MTEYIVQIEDSEKNMSERFVGQLRSYPELIRCKDCKHYWESAGMCTNAEFPVSDSIEPNDYCSRAEKETE